MSVSEHVVDVSVSVCGSGWDTSSVNSWLCCAHNIYNAFDQRGLVSEVLNADCVFYLL